MSHRRETHPGELDRIDGRADDYDRERPHSALGYETPAAFVAELNKQWPALREKNGAGDGIQLIKVKP